MSLNEKLKNLFGNKEITRKQAEAFLDTEEGEELVIAKIQKAMPDFYKEIKSSPIKEEKVEIIKNEPLKIDDIFEDKPCKEGENKCQEK